MKSDRTSFCVLPWMHSFVNIGGEYQVCCTSEEFPNTILSDEGKPLNISDRLSTSTVMNTKFMKELRLKMLAGEWDPLCTRCKITEDMGGVSRRHIENQRYGSEIESLIAQTSPTGEIATKVMSADYRLGNLCNLQCRMCGPRSSMRWLNDYNDVRPSQETLDDRKLAEYASYDWIEDPLLVQEFEQKAAGLQHLHFAGGEPLLAPQMRQILQKCIDLGVAKNIELTYNTNITKLPSEVLALWPHFKEIRLLCSVDGYGELNDYIRTGSHWSVIDKNLRFLDSNFRELKITEILLSTTVQAYNILYLDKLIEYLQSGFEKVVPYPNLINLLGPVYLRSQVLPASLKRLATSRMQKAKALAAPKIPDFKNYLLENTDQILNFMNDEDLSQQFVNFLEFTRRLDLKKGQSLRKVCPELALEAIANEERTTHHL